jgi:hypothetical protein
MYCRSGLVFGGTEGVGFRFHVLRARTPFRRNRGRRLPFSCFARRDSFLAVPCESDPVLMFCTLVLVFSCIEVPFSSFALTDSFSSVPRASVPSFMFCAPGLIFGGTEGVGSRFHVLRAQARFQRYRRCRVPFSSFALHDSFSAVPRESVLVFMFCAPGLVFGCTEGVRSRFHVLRTRTRFRPYRVCRVQITCLALPDSFSTVTRAQ